MKNVFAPETTTELLERINRLAPDTHPQWGKMTAPQMLAHLNVTYELAYENKHPRPGAFKRFLLRQFVKKIVVSEKPYKKSSPTAPEFLIKSDKDFQHEKQSLTAYIRKTEQLGAAYFEGRESHSFGPLTATEWNNMFYKHLDHHLTQFGV